MTPPTAPFATRRQTPKRLFLQQVRSIAPRIDSTPVPRLDPAREQRPDARQRGLLEILYTLYAVAMLALSNFLKEMRFLWLARRLLARTAGGVLAVLPSACRSRDRPSARQRTPPIELCELFQIITGFENDSLNLNASRLSPMSV